LHREWLISRVKKKIEPLRTHACLRTVQAKTTEFFSCFLCQLSGLCGEKSFLLFFLDTLSCISQYFASI
jgi:hypothetical protein